MEKIVGQLRNDLVIWDRPPDDTPIKSKAESFSIDYADAYACDYYPNLKEEDDTHLTSSQLFDIMKQTAERGYLEGYKEGLKDRET